jgi:hypothetical protein
MAGTLLRPRAARRLAPILAGIASAAFAGGCESPLGGGDEPSPEEAEVREVVTRAFTENDASHCTLLATRRFLEQVQDGPDAEAYENCVDDADDPPDAESLSFSSIEVAGERSAVTFSVTGGDSDGMVITLELRREPSGWKLDRMTDVEIDRARFDRAQVAAATREGLTEGEAACLAESYSDISTEDVEAALLDGDYESLRLGIVDCVSPPRIRELLAEKIEESASEDGIPPRVVDCVIARTDRETSDSQLGVLVVSGPTRAYERMAKRAVRSCARAYAAGDLPAAS